MSVCYYPGERIYFRPIEPADESLLRQWVNDVRNWRYLKRYLPVNEPREKEFIDRLYSSPADLVFGVVLRQADALIGAAGLHGIDAVSRRAELGILLGPEEIKGKGYGTEAVRLLLRYAFRELNLNRVALSVMDSNPRGIHVYEKAGFRLEGRSRQVYWRDGRYHDELHYAVLREDYERPAAPVNREDALKAMPASLCREDALV